MKAGQKITAGITDLVEVYFSVGKRLKPKRFSPSRLGVRVDSVVRMASVGMKTLASPSSY